MSRDLGIIKSSRILVYMGEYIIVLLFISFGKILHIIHSYVCVYIYIHMCVTCGDSNVLKR